MFMQVKYDEFVKMMRRPGDVVQGKQVKRRSDIWNYMMNNIKKA